MGSDRPGSEYHAKLPRPEFLNEQSLIFGACYESDAVLPDGTAPPDIADPITQYVPSAPLIPRRMSAKPWRHPSHDRLVRSGFVFYPVGRRGSKPSNPLPHLPIQTSWPARSDSTAVSPPWHQRTAPFSLHGYVLFHRPTIRPITRRCSSVLTCFYQVRSCHGWISPRPVLPRTTRFKNFWSNVGGNEQIHNDLVHCSQSPYIRSATVHSLPHPFSSSLFPLAICPSPTLSPTASPPSCCCPVSPISITCGPSPHVATKLSP